MQIILLRQKNAHATLSMGIVVTEKHQNNYFIQLKPPFLVVEFSNTLLFEEMLVLTAY